MARGHQGLTPLAIDSRPVGAKKRPVGASRTDGRANRTGPELRRTKTAMAKSKREELPALSEAQLEIMHVVWDGGEGTVTDVWNVLARRRPVARNTVLTLMDRLEKKGWLTRRADGQTHYYAAAAPRDATLGQVVRRLVDAAFAGSAEGLVLALLEGRGVSAAEARRIRQLIDNAQARRKQP